MSDCTTCQRRAAKGRRQCAWCAARGRRKVDINKRRKIIARDNERQGLPPDMPGNVRLIDLLVYVPGPVQIDDREPGDPTPEEIAERAAIERGKAIVAMCGGPGSSYQPPRVTEPSITGCRHNGRPMLRRAR